MKKLLLIFAFIPVLLFSQTRKQRKALQAQRKADEQIINNFKKHLQFFESNPKDSSDNLKNEQRTVTYISNQFSILGLQPKGTNGYLQPFKIDEGKQVASQSFLKVNGTLLTEKDYFPLPFSASKSVSGTPAMALKEKGVPWFTDANDWSEDDTKKNDSSITIRIQKEADRAASKGATALFIYNSSNIADNIGFDSKDKTPSSAIPVIYITPTGFKKYFADQSQVLDIELNVAFKEIIKNANNVVGYINNSAPSNIVIATPYSIVTRTKNDYTGTNIRKDMDDNVSGTSMLIELARILFTSKSKNSNYTFVAYTGEDTLSAESNWLNNTAITSNAGYIVNLDEVQRSGEDKKLLIESNKTVTSLAENIKPFADTNLEVIFDSSRFQTRQSSDYLKLPLLNISTMPNHELANNEKINYEGELRITRFISRMIEATNGKGKQSFSSINESTNKLFQPSLATTRKTREMF